jgi:hypothetical protein
LMVTRPARVPPLPRVHRLPAYETSSARGLTKEASGQSIDVVSQSSLRDANRTKFDRVLPRAPPSGQDLLQETVAPPPRREANRLRPSGLPFRETYSLSPAGVT